MGAADAAAAAAALTCDSGFLSTLITLTEPNRTEQQQQQCTRRRLACVKEKGLISNLFA